MRIKIDADRCKGCGLCIEVCPKKILKLSEKVNKKGMKSVLCINEAECISCASCAIMCPDCAITIFKE